MMTGLLYNCIDIYDIIYHYTITYDTHDTDDNTFQK
jgi:hypothetical protein